MAVKVFIPTPLRPHVGNRESLELEGATIREVLQSLTEQHGYASQAPLYPSGPSEELRQRLPERRRHSIPAEGRHGRQRRRYGEHRALHRRWQRSCHAARPAHPRRDSAVQPSPDHARGGPGGTAEAEAGQRPVHRRRRSGVTPGHVPGGGRSRPPRSRGFRRGGREQSAAADSPWNQRRGDGPS